MSFIQIGNTISAPISLVWEASVNPQDIANWNSASPDWYCPKAENELVVNGRFCYTMAARDGSFSFDFTGFFTEIMPESTLKYTLDDGRKVELFLEKIDENTTKVIQNFEPEDQNDKDFQKAGWQAILDNFKAYCENKSSL